MKICLTCEGISTLEQERCSNCGTLLLPAHAVHYPLRRGDADAANPLLGTLLDGKYRIQSVLGRGGMGTVFRALHEVSLVPVAIKLLHPRHGSRPEFRRALLDEARKAGRIVHDHCARILDVGETEDGTVYLAMELADGETLDAWVLHGGLPPSVAAEVLLQIARALAAIHAAGLVHRDLSARNVMLAVRDGAPFVKVLDFGIARTAAMAARRGRGADGAGAFANPVFSAPEQLAGHDVDARADIYSFGVIAWLLLCGTLPVDDDDPQAAARATAEGRLLALPPLPRVPRRLQRLLRRCLMRDPALRPADATALIGELEAVLGMRRGRLPGLSLLAAAAATVMMFLAFRTTAPPFLRPFASGPQWSDGPATADTPVQYVRSDSLQTLRCRFGAFAADRLAVDLVGGDRKKLSRLMLDPAVDRANDQLVLSTSQPGWQAAVHDMQRASVDGPLDVVFAIPGVALLAGARLRLDDEPPTVKVGLRGAGEPDNRQLSSGSSLDARIQDRVGIKATSVEVRFRDRGTITLQLPAGGELALGEALAARGLGCGDLGAGDVEVRAEDLAGNTAASERLAFAHCDVAAPAVTEASGTGGDTAVPFTGQEAQLRLSLSEAEAELQYSAFDPDGRAAELQPRGGGQRFDAVLRLPDGRAFVPGEWTFHIVDAAGNRSVSKLQLRFRDQRIDVVLIGQPQPGGGNTAEWSDPVLVVDAGGARVLLHCNPAMVVGSAELRSDGDAPLPEPPAPLLGTHSAGEAELQVPPLPAGSYRLVLRLQVSDFPGAELEKVCLLRVLPAHIVITAPAPASRFLRGLLDQGLLAIVGNTVTAGPACQLDPSLRPYVRGRLWTGQDALAPQPLPVAEPAAPLLPAVPLLRGRNVLALELHDSLGRPVQLEVGGAPAPRRSVGTASVQVLADFVHDDAPPGLVGDVLRVEHGQPARLHLRSALPFAPAEATLLRLGLGGSEIAADSVQVLADGSCEMRLQLPFAQWSQAAVLPDRERSGNRANLADLPPADYARGVDATIAAYLDTPAGKFQLTLPVRTARTTLRTLVAKDLPGGDSLPPALAGLVFVPVLAPDGEFADPVPAGAVGRALFRAQPDVAVRNLGDFLLLDREVTRAQYAAAVDAFLQLPAAARPPSRLLVHADDPLGSERLTDKGMLPVGFVGQDPDFANVAAAAPGSAVTGVDFFQAYTCCRLLGLLIAGDAAVLSLPLGAELDWAAFGRAALPANNAAAARGRPVRSSAFVLGAAVGDAAAELAAGDAAPTAFETPILGLDFGVREWVADLPYDASASLLLREWAADAQEQHRRVQAFADGDAPPAELAWRLRTFGVVRGLAFGEPGGLIDPATGGRVLPAAGPTLPAAVPGVTRSEQLRRDGRDLLPGRLDPRLMFVGFRVAAVGTFVQKARGR